MSTDTKIGRVDFDDPTFRAHRVDPWKNELAGTYERYDGRCTRCGDHGFWLTPMGIVTECPNLQLRFNDHPRPNDAAAKILLAGRQLARRDLVANPKCLDVARMLTQFTTSDPCPRQQLIDKYFGYARATKLREFHSVIEELRRLWLLPVASRKNAPAGYWIAVDQKDFAEWVVRAQSAPKTQLTTIFRLAKAHWPVYGEQLELGFWQDMEPAPVAAATMDQDSR
jgi:hypothetical protein